MRVVAGRAPPPDLPPVLAQEVEDGGRLRYVALYGPEVLSDVAVVVLQGAYGEIRREVYGADGRVYGPQARHELPVEDRARWVVGDVGADGPALADPETRRGAAGA